MATNVTRDRSQDLTPSQRTPEIAESEAPKREPAIRRIWEEPKGLKGILTTVSSQANGARIVQVAFALFLIAGFDATVIRIQLMVPNNSFVNAGTYDQTFTMHGSVMIFLFLVPCLQGIAMILLPSILGARTLPWPRLTAFVYWTFLIASVFLEFSWLVHYAQLFGILPGPDFGGVPDVGWTAFSPLSSRAFSPNVGIDFWLLANTLAMVGSIVGSSILIVGIFKMRAPGMSIRRVPLFAWSILIMSLLIFIAYIPQVVANTYLELDRRFGTHFFEPNGVGPLLWQQLFWTFGNAQEYIDLLPAAGIVSTILPVVMRQRISGYTLVASSFVTMGLLSFGLWLTHMYTVGLAPLALTIAMLVSLAIAIPAGVLVMAWLETIWRGQAKGNTPYLFMMGFVVLFVAGGITGVMLSLIPLDSQMQDSFFVVAHLHYMLVGAVVFPVFAAIYYWFPKFTGKLLSERIGKLNFWLLFIGTNVAFFPQFILGLYGMPRRIYTYPNIMSWDVLNIISTAGQFIMILGVAAFLANVLKTRWADTQAPPNPWNADTLEWATDSPLPPHGFHRIPIVSGRHPLWDEENPREGHERATKLVNHLAESPEDWRAQIVVDAWSGKPESVARVGGPSIMPLLAVIGLCALLAAFLFQGLALIALLTVGTAISIITIIMWDWRDKQEYETEEEKNEFERTHGVKLHPQGSPAISQWGVALMILAFAIALATAIFVYFYIRSNSSAWPPDGIARPNLLLPSLGIVVLLASAVAIYWAERSIRRDQPAALKLSLAAGFVLGVVYLLIQLVSLVQARFAPNTDTYGSVFYSIVVFMGLVTVIGLFTQVRTQVLAWREKLTQPDHQTVRNNAIYWYSVVVAWLVVTAVLYLTPYLS